MISKPSSFNITVLENGNVMFNQEELPLSLVGKRVSMELGKQPDNLFVLRGEVFLEMDLVSDSAQRVENSPSLQQFESPPDTPKPTPLESMLTEPAQAQTLSTQPEAIVTTNDLTMTEAEVPATSSGPAHSSEGTASPAATTPVTGGGSRGGIAAPSILSKTNPSYPSAARQAGLEGTVVLKVQILANGRPGEIIVSRSTGHSSLDDAAVVAVEKWRFVPAKDRNSGKTVACYTTLPVSFRLK